MTVKAMNAGAVEFLTKPVREQDLLDAVRAAFQRDRISRDREDEIRDLRSKSRGQIGGRPGADCG